VTDSILNQIELEKFVGSNPVWLASVMLKYSTFVDSKSQALERRPVADETVLLSVKSLELVVFES